MKLVYALLVAMLGDPDYRVRDAAQDCLRWMRPEADSALVVAARSPNPEVSVRSVRALKGPPPRTSPWAYQPVFVGFRFRSLVEVRYAGYQIHELSVVGFVADGRYVEVHSLKEPYLPIWLMEVNTVREQLRYTKQWPGVYKQRPEKP